MKKGFLTYLSKEFATVEINSSFYHLPRPSTFAKWRAETGDDFIFAVKMSRFITHQKRLADCREPLDRLLSAAKELQEKFGVVLIQLPPSLRYDKKLLQKFLSDLSKSRKKMKVKVRFALEPRHKSWMEGNASQEVRALLKKHAIAIVFPHSAKIPSFAPDDENILTDFVYVRFHGPSEFAASEYGRKRLVPWADQIVKWRKRSLTIFVYFNNDTHGHAIKDARTLKLLIGM